MSRRVGFSRRDVGGSMACDCSESRRSLLRTPLQVRCPSVPRPTGRIDQRRRGGGRMKCSRRRTGAALRPAARQATGAGAAGGYPGPCYTTSSLGTSLEGRGGIRRHTTEAHSGRAASCERVRLRRTLDQEAAGRGEYLQRGVRCAELTGMDFIVLMVAKMEKGQGREGEGKSRAKGGGEGKRGQGCWICARPRPSRTRMR